MLLTVTEVEGWRLLPEQNKGEWQEERRVAELVIDRWCNPRHCGGASDPTRHIVIEKGHRRAVTVSASACHHPKAVLFISGVLNHLFSAVFRSVCHLCHTHQHTMDSS